MDMLKAQYRQRGQGGQVNKSRKGQATNERQYRQRDGDVRSLKKLFGSVKPC